MDPCLGSMVRSLTYCAYKCSKCSLRQSQEDEEDRRLDISVVFPSEIYGLG